MRFLFSFLVLTITVPAFAQIDTTKTLGSASNKELFGEVLRRLAVSKQPTGWTPGTLMTTAKVDSFFKAVGWVRGLKDAEGNLRSATATEFGDMVWGSWYDQYWLGYKKMVKEKSITYVEQWP